MHKGRPGARDARPLHFLCQAQGRDLIEVWAHIEISPSGTFGLSCGPDKQGTGGQARACLGFAPGQTRPLRPTDPLASELGIGEMAFCPNCGTPNTDQAAKCVSCAFELAPAQKAKFK